MGIWDRLKGKTSPASPTPAIPETPVTPAIPATPAPPVAEMQMPENTELTAALQAIAQQDTAETRRELYRRLLESILIVPLGGDPPELPHEENGETSFALLAMQLQDGRQVAAAFADQASVLAWQPNGFPCIGLDARQFFTVVRNSPLTGIVINPAGPVAGGFISAVEVDILADGGYPDPPAQAPTPEPQDDGEGRMMIGPPERQLPEECYAKLDDIIDGFPFVESAYLLAMIKNNQPAEFAIGLRMVLPDQPDEILPPLFQAMLEVISSYETTGTNFTFFPIDDTLIAALKGTVSPFYVRE